MAKKLQLGYREIEQRLADAFGGAVNPDEVGYQLLYSFGKSERDIERYKEGKGILKTFDGLLIKGLFCYQKANMFGITEQLELLKSNAGVLKAAPKIIAVSDGKTLLAYDLRENDTYENQLERLPSDFAFFYPLMDVERVHYVEESPADVKAAEKLAKLHDELRSYNEFRSNDDLHDLNIFISRLLFCFFAEDTGIFEENLFTSSIQRYTKEDGSDISDYLDWSFNIMDVSLRHSDTPSIIKQFPYVNGGLFSKHIQIPKMGAKARRIIIECGELNWKDINPDIFGSMIQAVVNPEERANQGMHYTSVPNIMKVINPLFLDELRGEYNKLNEEYEQLLQMKKIGAIKETEFYAGCRPLSRKCQALLARMSKMKFFDPACGSGNFLIITYKCLRFLEMDILSLQLKCQADTQSMFVDTSVITLDQFYGIELLDFPHEVAMLSLWLAEHQMNTKLNENFGVNTKALPLKNITQIVCGNACRIDWNTVCPHTKDEEVFIFGNPPYMGSSLQDEKQKGDMESVFRKIKGWPNLDYIACWFYLGSTYIKGTKARCAFVSTKSICQGEQVALLWEVLINNQICLNFAYSGFRWNNNAKNKAHVFCVIIGIANESETEQAKLYTETEIKTGKRITPYLQLSDNNVIVKKERKSISNLPSMDYGSKPADGGNLILDSYEKEELIAKDKRAETFIYNYVGAEDYINGKKRYCLWISDNMKDEALSIPSIRERVHKVYEMRKGSKKKATQEDAEFPYRFAECRFDNSECIIIPRHTATDRKYIPFGYLPLNSVVADSSFAIYNAPVWLFGIVTSLMHMVWTKMFGGYLGTSIRYSNTICYNTFPFPQISAEKKLEIEAAAENVLITREYHPGQTLAELYDPDKMPQDLREAHAKLDDIVESCYPGYPFTSDEARLECLFKLYEKMTAK